MSVQIYVSLFLSPRDYGPTEEEGNIWSGDCSTRQPAVRKILDDYGASFEFEADAIPDEFGAVKLTLSEVNWDGVSTELIKTGLPFWAEVDPRQESDGDRFVEAAWGGKSQPIQCSWRGIPVVEVFKNGNSRPDQAKAARRYWRLLKKARHCVKPLQFRRKS